MNVVDNYKNIKSKGKTILSWIVSTNIYSVTQKKNTPRLQLKNVSSHKYIVNVTDHSIEVIFMSNFVPIISIL